jgi:hypothetical protein
MANFKVGDTAIVADEDSWYFDRVCEVKATTVYDELVIHTVVVGNVTFAIRDQDLKEAVEPHIPCCVNENRNMSGGCVSCGDPCL